MPDYSENIAPPEPMRILRSALPYLGFPMQRQLTFALKLMELQTMLRTPPPKPPDLSLVRGGETAPDAPTPQQSMQTRMKLLQSIRSACDPEHTRYVDTIMQTFRMQAMVQNLPATAAPSAGEEQRPEASPVIPFLRASAPQEKQPEKREALRPASNGDLENTLKSMLTPQQQAMFNSFRGMLKQQMPSSQEDDTKGGAANG